MKDMIEFPSQVNTPDEPFIRVVGGEPTTTSIDIAEKFGRQHKDVLRAVKNLDCSPDFNQRNFAPVKYLDEKGEKRPMYRVTRDGFVFLVMGFTGKKAAAWKEKYIAAFNAMAEVLARQANDSWRELRQQGKAARLLETSVIADFVSYAQRQGSTRANYYYPNITKATHKALFILKSGATGGFRDMLDGMQLAFLQSAEYVAANALREGMRQGLHYKEIYQLAKGRLEAFAETVGVSPVLPEKSAAGRIHAPKQQRPLVALFEADGGAWK